MRIAEKAARILLTVIGPFGLAVFFYRRLVFLWILLCPVLWNRR